MKRVSLLLLPLLLSCSTPSSVKPVSVPLQYKTVASPAEFPTFPPCAAVSRVEVVDKRADQNLGKRFVEGKNSAAAPVTTTSDVAAWTREAVEAAMKRGGITVGKAGAPLVQITVEQIATSENVLHRSGYEGRIVLSGELRAPGRDASCWQQRADGFSENYGYSGSSENYQETLNHAVDRAIIHLLEAPAFKSAVCSACSP
jgi:hypothetical protein